MQATIVVIEDEDQIAGAVAARLAAEGFRVEVAATGPDGVELCRRAAPDLVVLDWMLPGAGKAVDAGYLEGLSADALPGLSRLPARERAGVVARGDVQSTRHLGPAPSVPCSCAVPCLPP
jgi:CheY-like chemotaxis protein